MPPLSDPLAIEPLSGPVEAEVRVPGSKSYTNRALLIAAMAEGHSTLTGALFSEDTDHMAASLNALGISVQGFPVEGRFEIEGAAGRLPAQAAELFVGTAGTAARFLLAFAALGHGRYRLDGTPRMRQRPMAPLIDALGELGASVRSEQANGRLPIVVEGRGLTGGEARIAGDQSSQFLSALLMVGPCTREGVTLEVGGELVSRPYIDLTADVMAAFGARMNRSEYRRLTAAGQQRYLGRRYEVSPDASSASYFFAAAAITGGRVRVPGLAAGGSQGDLRFVEILGQMGCRTERVGDAVEVTGPQILAGVDVDMNDCSDMAQTLAAIAPFAESPTTLRNLAHTRLQESDRLSAMAAELRRLGQEVTEWEDGLRIEPRPVRPATVRTYQDHRMAMAFALVGLRVPGIRIADPGCVGKTFPDYFERLERLRGSR